MDQQNLSSQTDQQNLTGDMDALTAHSDGVWTLSGHIISAAIDPRVQFVAWAMAQLGWIAGPLTVVLFSYLAYYTCTLLIRCYAGDGDYIDDSNSDNNLFSSYPRAVQTRLGSGMQAKMCRLFQIISLLGLAIGHTDAASVSMMNLKGVPEMCSEDNSCDALPSTTLYLIIFGVAQIILSQITSFNLKSRLSIVAFVMTLIYSVIGVGVAIAKIAENHTLGGSLTGIPIGSALTPYDKIWSTFKALGDIAFAFRYHMIFIEIQGTRSLLPSEDSTMKRAHALSALATTFIYILHSVFGYAAFGDSAPRNVLSESFNPVWILKIANVATVIQLMIAYQVKCRPLFEFVEKRFAQRFSANNISKTLFRLAWRTVFVIITTGITILLPADDIGGLLVAIAFWPLMVYFPVAIYISQINISKWKWWALQTLRLGCFVVVVAASAGYVASFSFIPP